ncbi:MAG: phosphatidylserine decarboxylase [Thermoplasmata archaeon]
MIAKGTIHWVAIPLIIGILAILISIQYVSYLIYIIANVFFLSSVALALFFRDPPRSIGRGVVSPADGRVLKVDKAGGKLSIFVNIHNVHVNRAPFGGRVIRVERFLGGHSPAYLEKSESNESVKTTLATRLGRIKVIQTAGLLARRIVLYVSPGMKVRKGERIGMILFGSRVAVELPDGVRIILREGERVRAGETTIGEVVHDIAQKNITGWFSYD